MRTLIIAEAGVNHNGDMNLAHQLIAQAAAVGADLVKFQTFQARHIVSTTAPKAEYQKKATGEAESQFEMIRKLELSKPQHVELLRSCQQQGIGFFSTAFDTESFDLLVELDCLSWVKVPSGEITNLPFLRYMAKLGRPMLLSTGMATLGDIEAAIEVIEAAGTQRERITVLHCTTEYPAPMHEVNLRAMNAIAQAFGVRVGYSDHTQGIEVPIAAVALGATVIEKHFTLDRSLPGPDHAASLEPHEFKAMVQGIRNIEHALGNGIKQPTASEIKNKAIARKSIVARRAIQVGEVFTEYNLTTKRPGTGVSPMRWDEVLGKVATRTYEADEIIKLWGNA